MAVIDGANRDLMDTAVGVGRPLLQAALKGTNPVVIGLIAVVALDMGRKQVKDCSSALLVVAAFAGTAFLKLNAAVVLLAAVCWSLGVGLYRRRHC